MSRTLGVCMIVRDEAAHIERALTSVRDRTTALFARAEQLFPTSPDLPFVMADVLLEWALTTPAEARAILPVMGAFLRRCLELGEQPHLPGTVRGRGSHLAHQNLQVWKETCAALGL